MILVCGSQSLPCTLGGTAGCPGLWIASRNSPTTHGAHSPSALSQRGRARGHIKIWVCPRMLSTRRMWVRGEARFYTYRARSQHVQNLSNLTANIWNRLKIFPQFDDNPKNEHDVNWVLNLKDNFLSYQLFPSMNNATEYILDYCLTFF